MKLAEDSSDLLHNGLCARTLARFERMSAAQLTSHLSRQSIGQELRGQPFAEANTIVLAGADALRQGYALALALSSRDVQSTRLGSAATWAGLHSFAARIAKKRLKAPAATLASDQASTPVGGNRANTTISIAAHQYCTSTSGLFDSINCARSLDPWRLGQDEPP